MSYKTYQFPIHTIKEIRTRAALNTRVEIVCLVKSANTLTTKTNKPYAAMTLQDATGTIEARGWNISEPAPAGTIIRASGKVAEWQGERQLNVDFWRTEEEANPADFAESAHRPAAELYAEVCELVQLHGREPITTLVLRILDNHDEALLSWPAASRHHHARVGGLIEHVHSMCQLAMVACDHYAARYKHSPDRALVIAGVVLHDLGKLTELSGPIGTEYTDAGKLMGHIPQGLLMLEQYLRLSTVGEEDSQRLRHLILSHHGRKEWGSPVEPRTPEAILLHLVDMLDSRMDAALSAWDAADTEGWISLGHREELFVGRNEEEVPQ